MMPTIGTARSVRRLTPRIDALTAGTAVLLTFDGGAPEPALFLHVEGTGEKRVAYFAQVEVGADKARTYTWGAYRFEGRWVYGSGASTLRLHSVLAVPEN